MTHRPTPTGPATTPSRRRSGLIVAAGALLLGLSVAGCTGGASAPTSAPSPGASGSTAPSSTEPSASSTPGAGPSRTPAQTPVPAPTAGTTAETVSPRTIEERSPVAIDATSRTSDRVQVTITKVRALQVQAQGPGEVSGPGVAVTVEVHNGSTAPLALDLASTSLTGTDGAPAAEMGGSPADPLAGTVAAGEDARGVYVFTLAKAQRSKVRFTLSLDPATPTAVFTGRVA